MTKENIALSELCDVVMGQSPPSATYNSQGNGLPFFQGKTDFGDIYPDVRMFCSQPARIAEAGDILISVRAPVGPTNLNRQQCCIGRGLAALRANNRLNQKYLFWYLRYHEPKLSTQGRGSTFDAINRDDLEEMRIPYLELPAQEQIVRRLDQADHLCHLRQYALEMSESFLPAVFIEMFGDPVRNTHEYPTESLGNLGDVTTGGTPPSVKSGMFGGKIPFITPGDLEVDTQHSQRFLTDAGVKESVSVRAGSTLVCCIGATIGKTDKARVRCSFNQQINAVEWGKNINDDFGFYLMRFFSRVIADRGRSTTLPILKKSAFEELILPVPPMPFQQKFSDIVKRHGRLHSSQGESLRQAEHLFQSLLHQAFSEN
jgi:type I restriction enzyme S subunit